MWTKHWEANNAVSAAQENVLASRDRSVLAVDGVYKKRVSSLKGLKNIVDEFSRTVVKK